MNYSLVDARGLLLAIVSYVPLLLLPGAALAYLVDAFGFRARPDVRKPIAALLVGIGVLPALDSLVTRFSGLDSAVLFNVALAMVAIGIVVRSGWRVQLSIWPVALFGVWLVVLMVEWIDFDIAGKLYQPYLVFDMVKHAATSQAILDTGAPPRDPFFLRPERVSYYYFFYTLAALSQRVGFGLIDARAAVGGLVFWVGIGLLGVIRLLLARGTFVADDHGKALRFLPIMILAASGCDIIFVILWGQTAGIWLADPAWWNEQVTGWFESLLWVPHHVVALVALFVGFIAAVDGVRHDASTRWRALGGIGLAGVCFASALGLSVWVTLAGATTAAIWFLILVVERRWRAVGVLGLIGLTALLVAMPQILDMRSGRQGGEVPIALTIRAFIPLDMMLPPGPIDLVARLLLLPVNYTLEFGVLALGTWLYWRDQRRKGHTPDELARVVTIAAVAGLGLGTFLQSTLLNNNDLGWRVMLLPSLAGVVWTVAALDRRWSALSSGAWTRATPIAILAFLGIGYATTLYASVGLRAYHAFASVLPHYAREFAAHPETQHALREAYDWADAHLPAAAVLQHNPSNTSNATRAVAFGLYSRNRVALADSFGALFGADPKQVFKRLETLGVLYKPGLSTRDVRDTARANGVDDLVVTADDPVWSDKTSWVWRASPVYESARVRIVPVAAIGLERIGSLP